MLPESLIQANKELVEFSSTPSSEHIFQVALPVPLRTLFEYRANNLSRTPLIGDRVRVSFGNRELTGVILKEKSIQEAQFPDKLKNIIEVFPAHTALNSELLRLLHWAAEYYLCPIGETISAAIPPYLRVNEDVDRSEHWRHTTEGLGLALDALKRSPKQQDFHRFLLKNTRCSEEEVKTKGFSPSAVKALSKKGLIEKARDDLNSIPTSNDFDIPPEAHESEIPSQKILNEPGLELNEEQRQALENIRFHQFNSYLLHGITGSGKTEIYLQLATRALAAGKQVLILVPEIGLSPQTVERFRKRFAVQLVELHSGVSDKQRAKNWLAARNGQAKIIIGTRLAALCIMKSLGLIIVDEEHDGSYKQQDSIRYSARDLSIVRAKMNQIPIILGSATPSLESLKHALEGHYQHIVLRRRATGVMQPEIQCINVCNEIMDAGMSKGALESIRHCLESGGQALVFLNRRGYAPMQLCHSCGWVAQCTSCSSNMTLHKRPNRLHCHHCDKRMKVFDHCPRCGGAELSPKGIGTEQLDSSLQSIFPHTTVLRIDRDSTSKKAEMKARFDQIHSGKPAILVGTQMIAKGHHFPNLKLVLIADADQGFLNPDFRAVEKMGQLLVQVAGRAGREKQQGKVLVQSHQPDHPLLQLLITKGYTAFAKELLSHRAHNRLPPFWHSAIFRAESKRSENATQLLSTLLQRYRTQYPPSNTVQTLGPIPSALERVQERYRYQLQFVAQNRMELKSILKELIMYLEQQALSKRVRWSLDVDPADSA